MERINSRRLGVIGVALAALALSGLGGSAPQASAEMSAAAAQVVKSPRPGARVSRNRLHIVVRAGNEFNDVRARLNGVAVGREFSRRGEGLRVLQASTSHGLRHGTNVLRVWARRGTSVRRATVRFRVVRPVHLLGAGRDRRVPAGFAIRLSGKIRPKLARTSASRIRWKVISAPRRSRFGKVRSAKGAVGAQLRTRGTSTAPLARFRPDVRGHYRLRLTASAGGRAVTDIVDVDTTPRSSVLTVDTATSTNGVPGIRVGPTNFLAPALGRDASGNPVWSGVTENTPFYALWQVVALDRGTLATIWNRTYGVCAAPGLAPLICRLTSGGKLVFPDAGQDLNALGPNAFVIASSHPAGSARNGTSYWGQPNEVDFATGDLTAIGFPHGDSDVTVLDSATAGSVSAIGVPGMGFGEADINVIPGGSGEMRGYLGEDPNDNFGFMPSARFPFDTRASMSCANGQCTVTQTIGEEIQTGTIKDGQGGYLVATYDEHNLDKTAAQMFTTTGEFGPDGGGMWDFLSKIPRDRVVMITSVRTPGLGTRPMPDPELQFDLDPGRVWHLLADMVASVGGTHHTFNTSAAGQDLYTLVGWGGAGEGNGVEIAGGDGRLRGAFVPDNRSRFRPVNVSADGPAAELLSQLVVKAPVTTWPLDEDPAAHRALKWIGSQIPALGSSPRTAYWYQDIDQAAAGQIIDMINQLPVEVGSLGDFGADDYVKARTQLIKEVRWVGNVRTYLDKLSLPQKDEDNKAWQNAQDLNNDLTEELEGLKEEAEVEYAWFDIVESLLDLAAGFSEFSKAAKSFGKYAEVFAASTLFTGSVFEKAWDGGPSTTAGRTVEVDKIGDQIEADATRTIKGYDRMGDMIVNDPTKLEELGTYAGCNPLDGGCGADGQYAEFAQPDKYAPRAAAAASLAIEQVLYKRIVQLAFPVWYTGRTSNPDPSLFTCLNGADNPFSGSPERARTAVLQQIDVVRPGVPSADGFNRWLSYLYVARSRLTYAWPSEEILDRMYNPVLPTDDGTDPDSGLGLSAQDILPYATSVYTPGGVVDCWWP